MWIVMHDTLQNMLLLYRGNNAAVIEIKDYWQRMRLERGPSWLRNQQSKDWKERGKKEERECGEEEKSICRKISQKSVHEFLKEMENAHINE